MNAKIILVVFLTVLFLVPQFLSAKILFFDDFESDTIGEEPSNWKVVDAPPGDPPGAIVNDPDGGANKVLLASIRGDKNGRIYVAGEPDWVDMVVRFDWYLLKDGIQHGTVFRYTDRNTHYLFDRRSPAAGNALNFYRKSGGTWTQLVSTPMVTNIKTWYTVLLIVNGDTFQVKMKEKADNTLFANLEVIVECKDASYKDGYFGTYASEEPDVAFYDNVVIGENEDEVANATSLSVGSANKLATTWGRIKI